MAYPTRNAESYEGGLMIARIWRGAVAQGNGDAYAQYIHDTGVAGYAGAEGNRGVWMLPRESTARPSS
jgi:hypothetical protein